MRPVRLLGTFSIGSGSVARCPGIGAAGRECIGYLFQNLNQLIDRGQILAQFWDSHDGDDARSALNLTTSRLRRALLHKSLSNIIELRADKWCVGLFANQSVLSDTQDLENFYRIISNLSNSEANEIELDIPTYGGDFLSGHYISNWVYYEREKLRSFYVRSMIIISDNFIQKQSYCDAADCCRAILQHDPLREAAQRRLMLVHAIRGEVGRFRADFTRFCEFMERHCDAQPSGRTRALFDALDREPSHSDLIDMAAREIAVR